MKHHLVSALVVVSMVLGGVIAGLTEDATGQLPPAEHRFRVGKLDNMWKVYDSKDPKNRTIVAKRGDKIFWTALGSDIFLNFPDETIFGTAEASAADGKEVMLTVSPNAKPGRYTYSVFCAKERKFATGDSPPVIIIQ